MFKLWFLLSENRRVDINKTIIFFQSCEAKESQKKVSSCLFIYFVKGKKLVVVVVLNILIFPIKAYS